MIVFPLAENKTKSDENTVNRYIPLKYFISKLKQILFNIWYCTHALLDNRFDKGQLAPHTKTSYLYDKCNVLPFEINEELKCLRPITRILRTAAWEVNWNSIYPSLYLCQYCLDVYDIKIMDLIILNDFQIEKLSWVVEFKN